MFIPLAISFSIMAYEYDVMRRYLRINNCDDDGPVDLTRVGPGQMHSVEYGLHTAYGVNSFCFPAEVRRINQVFLRQSDTDFDLIPVHCDVNMLASYGHLGRPAFYQVFPAGFDLQMRVWPIPNDVYALHVCAFAGQELRGFAAKANSSHDKAFVLLDSWLTAEQRLSLSANGYFYVRGGSTGHRYRISKGCVFNVQQLSDDGGFVVRNLCFVPDNAPFVGDTMLAQKIMLENDEERALRIANKQPVLPA